MEEILKKLTEQEVKIDAMYASVEKLRKYFMWTLIITAVTVILPLLVMIIAVPYLMSTFSSLYQLPIN